MQLETTLLQNHSLTCLNLAKLNSGQSSVSGKGHLWNTWTVKWFYCSSPFVLFCLAWFLLIQIRRQVWSRKTNVTIQNVDLNVGKRIARGWGNQFFRRNRFFCLRWHVLRHRTNKVLIISFKLTRQFKLSFTWLFWGMNITGIKLTAGHNTIHY